MNSEEGQQGSAYDMQPMWDLVDRQAGLVGVKNRFQGEDFHQLLFKGLQGVVLLLPGGLNGGFADGIIKYLPAHFTDPQAGSLLDVVEIREQSAEVLPVLDWGFDVGWKGRGAGPMAAGALFGFGPVFGAFQFQGRQVEDLAALKVNGRL